MLLLYSATAHKGHTAPGRIRGSTNIQNSKQNLTMETFWVGWRSFKKKEKIYLVDAESKVRFQYNYVVEVCHEGMQQSFHKNTQIGVTRLLGGSILPLGDKEDAAQTLNCRSYNQISYNSMTFRHNCWYVYIHFGNLAFLFCVIN